MGNLDCAERQARLERFIWLLKECIKLCEDIEFLPDLEQPQEEEGELEIEMPIGMWGQEVQPGTMSPELEREIEQEYLLDDA